MGGCPSSLCSLRVTLCLSTLHLSTEGSFGPDRHKRVPLPLPANAFVHVIKMLGLEMTLHSPTVSVSLQRFQQEEDRSAGSRKDTVGYTAAETISEGGKRDHKPKNAGVSRTVFLSLPDAGTL